MTIHKSQGQTIQRVKVDLSRVFETGQVYTALSRTVSADCLEVAGSDDGKVSVDTVALRFCKQKNILQIVFSHFKTQRCCTRNTVRRYLHRTNNNRVTRDTIAEATYVYTIY
jgi:hypothetical protein